MRVGFRIRCLIALADDVSVHSEKTWGTPELVVSCDRALFPRHDVGLSEIARALFALALDCLANSVR